MVDEKTRLDSVVNNILGIFTDLQQKRKRCCECRELATLSSKRSSWKSNAVYYCQDCATELEIEYEEDDDENDEDYGDGYNEDYNFTKE